MSYQFKNIEELRTKKALLKADLNGMEDLLTFKHPKESLSVMTGGTSDRYLVQTISADGQEKIKVDTKEITRSVSNTMRRKILNKNALNKFTDHALETGAVNNVLHVGLVTVIAGTARKNLQDKSWKNKIIGLALLVLTPKIIKFIDEKLFDFQKNTSLNSMRSLI